MVIPWSKGHIEDKLKPRLVQFTNRALHHSPTIYYICTFYALFVV